MGLRRVAWLAGLMLAASAWAGGASLEVELTGVRHERGQVRVGLYQDARTFRKEVQALAVRTAPATSGLARVRFDNLPAGRYAVMAYHDEDESGKLNLRLGMFPTEGYGLSNNPKVYGPPAFEDSAFEVKEGAATELKIDLRY